MTPGQLWQDHLHLCPLSRLASYGRIKHGLADAFEAATRADLSGEYYGQVTGAIKLLLDLVMDGLHPKA